MTVIAWDGKTLAADKRSTNMGLIHTVTKIFRVRGALVAIDGDFAQGLLMVEWIRNGCDPDTFPESQSDDDKWTNITVADKDGIHVYEQTPCPIHFEDKIYASGSGRDFALAAMHLGKTAAEACEVASIFHSGCGNGVDSFEV
jgi:20S proteasome alpha/beta subunit